MNAMDASSYLINEVRLKWYALHARSRHEDVVYHGLRRKSNWYQGKTCLSQRGRDIITPDITWHRQDCEESGLYKKG
jgi:hypothetical protein